MHELRLKKLHDLLKSEKIDALLVSSIPNIFYLTGVDYFTPEERYAYMFVTNRKTYLFTDKRYIEAVKKIVPKRVKPLLNTELFKILKKSNVKDIGFEQNLTFAEHNRFKRETNKKFYLTDWLIEKLRSVKDPGEIKNISAACSLTDKTYSHVLKNIRRTNITEKEIAWRIEKFIKENGGELAFDTIVAFGENAAIPHHKTSNKKLADKDQFVLLDFGAKVNSYCSDMTRSLLTKDASSRAHKMYETVLAAQQKAIKYINEEWYDRSYYSLKASSASTIANRTIIKNGFSEIPHGLGHGLGLEVHESPRLSPKSKDKLVRNNVFTIEPGIYIPGFGGVRIEDNFLLTANDLKQLTKSPKDIIAPI